MANLLHLDSSAKGSMSVTRPLTQYFAELWQEKHRDGKVVYRDLLKSELKFVNDEIVGAYYTAPDQLTAQQKTTLAKSDELIKELVEADTYVFGVPMYNFSVPAVFKAYVDLIVRVGQTFVFEEGRPKGLLQNKSLIVITSSGADYSEAPWKAMDFVEPYLRAISASWV